MSTPADLPVAQRTRWGVVVMLMGFPLLGHFNRIAISVVGSERLIGPSGLTGAQMGVVYTTFLLVYTCCMLPGGWFIDRVGPASALRNMAFGFGFCAMLTGVLGWLALPLSVLWGCLVLLRGIAGASSSPLHPGAARGVALWTAPGARSTANGLIGAAALIGVSITYPGFGWLMDRFDWPAALLIGGAALFLFGLFWHRVAPRPAGDAADSAVDTADRHAAALRLLRHRSLLLLTASYTAVGYVQYLFFYWIEFYFEHVLHRSTDESRWASFVITMSMAVGMALGGRCSDSVCQRWGDRLGRRMIALGGMGLCALFAYLGVQSSDVARVTVLFSLSLGALGVCEGIFWTTATDLGGRYGGLAAALMNTGGNSLSALAPTITPLIAKRLGWDAAIGFACAICGLGAALWLAIDPAPADAEPAD